MNVLVLEHPRLPSEKHFNDIANTPLWSCLMAGYAAASLQQKGCRATLLDANQPNQGFEDTAAEILNCNPDLLCVHAVYFWEQTHRLIDFLNHLRTLGYTGPMVLFGFFPTLAYRALLEAVPAVDAIAVGECEHTLAELADCLATDRPWREIPGLAVRDGGGAVSLILRKPEANPDGFPYPLRRVTRGETVGLLASRGCYNHCRFCPVPAFYHNGPMWRGRAPEHVAREVAALKAQGADDFYFLDPNFIGPGKLGKARTRALCRLLEPLGITFGMETRANDLDADLLQALRAAGLQSLLIGIESGSPRVLGCLDKHGSVAAAEAAIRMCRNAGIEPEVGFLMFVPDSTVADLSQNLDFLKRNALLDRLDRTANILSHRQIVFMGTSGYEMFKSQGRLTASGPLGFQAEVAWADPEVRWVAQIIEYACHWVLKETGRRESPLFWQKHADWRACGTVNDYLVDLFDQCLSAVRGSRPVTEVPDMQAAVEEELGAIIRRMPLERSENPTLTGTIP